MDWILVHSQAPLRLLRKGLAENSTFLKQNNLSSWAEPARHLTERSTNQDQTDSILNREPNREPNRTANRTVRHTANTNRTVQHSYKNQF